MKPGGPPQSLRRHNRSAILTEIHRRGACTRRELADSTALTPATVTRIVAELIECGLVVNGRYEGSRSGVGRRPSALCVNHKRLFVAGMHVGLKYVDIGLFDLQANLIARSRKPHVPVQAPEPSLELAVDTIESLIDEQRLSREDLAAVGVGTGGWVDPDKGLVRLLPQLDWHDVPVRDFLQSRLERVTALENIVNAMALAEARYGVGRGVENLVLIMVGNVLGAGIVVDGRIYPGSSFLSGQLGHIVVDRDGPLCSCGNRGCLDALASDSVLIQMIASGSHGKRDASTPTIEQILKGAEEDVAAMRQPVEQRAQLIGRMVAMVTSLYDPSLVVLAGSAALAPEVQLPRIVAAAHKDMFPPSRDAVSIRLSSFGDRASLVGAAAPAIELVYSSRLNVVQEPDGQLRPVLSLDAGRHTRRTADWRS